MVATVCALTGKAPQPTSATAPHPVRGDLPGVMGVFELAATVDYLFGYDTATGVVVDRMYEKLAQEYVFDPETAKFLRVQPLGPPRHHRAPPGSRGPRPVGTPRTGHLANLRQAYLDTEADLEAE